MSTTPKIRIEMTPTQVGAFRKQFMKAQENMKHAFELDLKDVMRKVTTRNTMNTAYDHLYGEPPKQPGPFFDVKPKNKPKILVVGDGVYQGKMAAIDMIKKIKEEMRTISPCINLGSMVPPSIVLDSCSNFEIKGSDFEGALPGSGVRQLQDALLKLGQCGFNAAEAGRNLSKVMKKMQKTPTIHDDNNVSYGKRQAQHWAHKYSHKIRRKL